jgi:hypothetical protein
MPQTLLRDRNNEFLCGLEVVSAMLEESRTRPKYRRVSRLGTAIILMDRGFLVLSTDLLRVLTREVCISSHQSALGLALGT